MGRSRYKHTTINGKTYSVHRLVMERHLGRKLERNELVHHENRDRYDNRIDNLVVTNHKAHSIEHNQKHPLTKKCAKCSGEFTPHPTKRARQVTCSRSCFAALSAENARRQMADGGPGAKLTWAKADDIRQRLRAGESVFRLAAEFGVHEDTIISIGVGKTWREERRPS